LPVGCHNIDRFYQRSVTQLSSEDELYTAAQEALQAKNKAVMSVFEPTPQVFNPNQRQLNESLPVSSESIQQ
jgi:hypothetical protein